MGTKEAPPSHEGPPPPVTHGGRGPSRRPGGPVRPPPALPSRDSAHELSPDTCVRPGQWLALASRQRSLRGVGVTTAPSGVQCSKLCLPGHVGRSASWDSRGERSDREAGGGSLRNVEQRSGLLPGGRRSGTQVGDAPQARCSLSVVGAHVCVVRRGEKPQRASGKRRRFLQHGRVSCFGACAVGRDSSPRSSGF